ncbi:MAG: hypothetical protein K2G13_02910, partial [Muribaculaceae bacterium]|nr:hypothetical protein [Muribaculaceae bacterium]
KEGSCVISATAADVSGVSAECIITSVAGVDSIFSSDDKFDVFDVNGVLVMKGCGKDSFRKLAQGIYLIRNNGVVKKLFIK